MALKIGDVVYVKENVWNIDKRTPKIVIGTGERCIVKQLHLDNYHVEVRTPREYNGKNTWWLPIEKLHVRKNVDIQPEDKARPQGAFLNGKYKLARDCFSKPAGTLIHINPRETTYAIWYDRIDSTVADVYAGHANVHALFDNGTIVEPNTAPLNGPVAPDVDTVYSLGDMVEYVMYGISVSHGSIADLLMLAPHGMWIHYKKHIDAVFMHANLDGTDKLVDSCNWVFYPIANVEKQSWVKGHEGYSFTPAYVWPALPRSVELSRNRIITEVLNYDVE